jgi:hypothetical protein
MNVSKPPVADTARESEGRPTLFGILFEQRREGTVGSITATDPGAINGND